MPDLTKCTNNRCVKKLECYRFTSVPSSANQAFDNLITNGMEEFHGLKDFKADFGFHEPIRTKTECSNPEFHDHKLHRVAIMKDEHFGSKGDRDEGGIAGWTSKLVCVGCGKEFQGQNGFYLDKQREVKP